MNLPKNGRIVIVDDKIEEAQPLINILSKKRLPFNYYTGTDASAFPSDPINNKFRVFFLDLNIFEQNKTTKQVVSVLHSILTALIPDFPNPYLLIIWSKQDNDYRLALEEHFKTILTKKQPAKIIFLQKGKYFDLEDGKWNPKANSISLIEQDILIELDSISLLGPLMFWENLIHDSVSETISDFSTFHTIDNKWNGKMKPIIYKMARAIVGRDDILKINNKEKLRKALFILSEILSDKLEYYLESSDLLEIGGINDAAVEEDVVVSLNTRLHCLINNKQLISYFPGNLYQVDDLITRIPKIINEKVFKSETEIILAATPSLVQLDITPICDYSQDKNYIRTIYGVSLPSSVLKNVKSKKKDYHYITPIIKLNKENRFILLDFRYISTSNKSFYDLRQLAPVLRFRRELSLDIQAEVASQINRPGISTIE